MRTNSPGPSVLIVEDFRPMRLLIRGLLHSFGIGSIVEVTDGLSGLEILRRQKVDVVITDIHMEPMDGIEFTRRLRRPNNGLNPYIPVLAISGDTEASRVKEAFNAGVTAFLAKPITSAALKAKLNAILHSPQRTVSARNYCGPDRRRSEVKTHKRRRATDGEIVEI